MNYDVAIILRQLKFKKSQSTNTFHNERKKFSNRCSSRKKKERQNQIMKFYAYSFRLHDVITFWRNWPFTSSGSGIIKIFFIANRYSSIRCIKDKSIATCTSAIRLLLLFENLRLTLAKKRCEWVCNKTSISETFCVFPLDKTSGYHLKVFVFKLNQICIC